MSPIYFVRNVHTGIKSLMLHKLRSMLTILGVVFGVGSVVAMLSVGEGASAEALNQIEKLGSRNIIVRSVKPQEDRQVTSSSRRSYMSIYGLLYEDELRVAGLPSVKRTVAAKTMRKEMRLGSRSTDVRVVATTPAWFELVERPMIAGRPLNARDMEKHAAVCVVSEQPARKVLATHHVVGQHVRVGGETYRVVGIVRSETGNGDVPVPDQPDDVYIPLNVARQRMGDIVSQNTSGLFIRERVELRELIVQVDSIDRVESTAAAIRAVLDRFHKKNDYTITVPLALLNQARETQRIFNIVLGSIAGISLLVGGIGIMNIMLASVTERTREIGIRRAIGARRNQIIGQFLTETVVLSSVGGIIGVGMGLLIPTVITHFADLPTIVTAWSIVLSLSISVAIGIIFGMYPAYRAAMLDPIVALRHE